MSNAGAAEGHRTSSKVAYKEADFDSILVKQVFLPYCDPVNNVPFGLVNTVQDEIDLLIRKFQLHLPAQSCTLVMTRHCGVSVAMDPGNRIEDYLADLSSHGTVVRLIHTQAPTAHYQGQPYTEQPSLAFFGVHPR